MTKLVSVNNLLIILQDLELHIIFNCSTFKEKEV